MKISDIRNGMRLRWHDPDDGLCDCEGVVTDFDSEDPEFEVDEETVVVLKRDDGTEVEAYACELEPVRRKKRKGCRNGK